ncbi:hypothetical protein CAC42_7062 [Sphaceloma murrayae]|uniref:Cupin type-2 domain-containing protein n=1 Tax=Sphaceloma murrayae TaxID=2082308 RepID=A0A2K1QQW8_9PEZI|nr:hypothetical protein CAC42_7062 [Sphaceloma murrayae]
MPMTLVPNATTLTSLAKGKTFVGDVYLDKAHANPATSSTPSTMMATVTFTPGSRTNWHKHEHGQILKVEAGSGWICDRGGKAKRIKSGDLISCPAGTEHWHGADEGSVLTHFVVSLGTTSWGEEVTEDEYKARE